MKTDKWFLFQEFIAMLFQEIAPNARSTKASGASTEKGDIKGVPNLQIECKDYKLDSVYKEEWMEKVINEVPLHVKKIPVLFTRNKNGKMRAHLNAEDFSRLYVEFYKLKHGESNEK